MASSAWYVFIDHQGKRKAKCIGDSKRAAEEVKRKLEAKLTLGEFDLDDEKPAVPTFQEYAEEWLKTHARHNCKVSTYHRYRSILRLHLVPKLGTLQMTEMTREQVRQVAYGVREKLSQAGTRSVLAVLRSILGQAVEDALIPSNPAARISRYLPKRPERTREIDPLTRQEVAHLLTTIQHHEPRYYPFFLLLARTGLRLGEACALQWDDIDWHSQIIHVRRSLRDGRLRTTKSGKTRRVDMSPQLTPALQAWQMQCELEAIGRGLTELSAWVFPTKSGQPVHASHIRARVWQACLIHAGLRYVRIHDLRHTYASLLIQQGESLAYIRDQLGHASIQMTVNIYGHLVPGGNRQAVARLDDTPECNLGATRETRATVRERKTIRKQ